MDPLLIIKKYVDPSSDAYRILVDHSTSVANLAVSMGKAHPELDIDLQFVQEAAMLHDIGIIRTAAESIDCHGDEPYICHGVLGAEILRSEGLDKHALGHGLPIPSRDMLPVSLEEKLICYADKFFSKTHLGEQRSVDVARKKLEKFGPETLRRFDELHALFK